MRSNAAWRSATIWRPLASRRVVPRRREPIVRVDVEIDRARRMAKPRQLVAEPANPRAHVEHAQAAGIDPRRPTKRHEGLISFRGPWSALVDSYQRVVGVDFGQPAVALGFCIAIALGAADRRVVAQEWREVLGTLRRQHAPDPVDPRVAAMGLAAQFVRPGPLQRRTTSRARERQALIEAPRLLDCLYLVQASISKPVRSAARRHHVDRYQALGRPDWFGYTRSKRKSS